MSNKKIAGDHNEDGIVNYLDDITYIFKLMAPYILIGVGLFAPVPDRTREWVIAGGLGLAGTTGERKKREIIMPVQSSSLNGIDEPEWY